MISVALPHRARAYLAQRPPDCATCCGPEIGPNHSELLTASNAAILGATTAPAMAAAKGWHDRDPRRAGWRDWLRAGHLHWYCVVPIVVGEFC